MRELIPHVCCLCTPDEFAEVIAANSHQEIYVHNGEGYLKHVKLSGGRHVRIKVEKLPHSAAAPTVAPLKEELNFLPAGKIPYEFFEQIVEFFRQVSKKMKSEFEAHAWILWSAEKGYFISVPKQTVGKASVSFTYDDESLPPGSVIVVDIHSHNTMGAFYSGTDDNNDKSGIYYSAVIGKLTDTNFEYVIRFNLYEQKKTCKLDEVFIITPKVVTVPEEWLGRVDETVHRSNIIVHPGSHGSRRNFRGQGSLWDQRAGYNSGDGLQGDGYGPFGFNELDPAYLQQAAEQAKERGGKGGKKDKSKKEVPQDGRTSDDSFVPGPLDDTVPPHLRDLTHEELVACGYAEVDDDDSPGLDDLDDLEGYGEKYGPEALEAYHLIEDFLDNLEECDEPLLEIIKHAYAILSTDGQMEIAQNGMR